MKTLISSLALGTLILAGTASTVEARDIEDWLRNTFSTRDYVGDWLKDVFGPVHNSGGSTPSPDINLPEYREAVLVMERWDRGELKRLKSISSPMRQICSDETLLSVIVETRSQEMTQRICFKTTTVYGAKLEPVRRVRANRAVAKSPKLGAIRGE